MKFETVQLEHVQRGVQDIKSKGLPIGFAHSLYFDVEVDGELHSPKALMAYANEHATGKAPKKQFQRRSKHTLLQGVRTIRDSDHSKIEFKSDRSLYWPLQTVDFRNIRVTARGQGLQRALQMGNGPMVSG